MFSTSGFHEVFAVMMENNYLRNFDRSTDFRICYGCGASGERFDNIDEMLSRFRW